MKKQQTRPHSTGYTEIRSKGYTITFLENEAKLPRNTLQNFINGAKPLLDKHKPSVKKIFKKYKINLLVV